MSEAALEAADGKRKEIHAYPLGEEIANSITHGIGIVASLVALVFLAIDGYNTGNTAALVSGIVFGSSLVLEYTASTLYHALPAPGAKHVFKIIDHAGIYLLIAGSYTPFCVVSLADSGGIPLLIVIWSMAILGIIVEAFWAYRPRWVSVTIYLIMGWAVVFTLPALARTLDPGALWLLALGGVAYTVGTPFYIFKRVPYFHMVWHLWVIAGSALHVLAVLLYVF